MGITVMQIRSNCSWIKNSSLLKYYFGIAVSITAIVRNNPLRFLALPILAKYSIELEKPTTQHCNSCLNEAYLTYLILKALLESCSSSCLGTILNSEVANKSTKKIGTK